MKTWADPGGGPPPLFLAKSILFFYIVYSVWKNIFEIEIIFYRNRNPMSFWKCRGVGLCVCVCDPIGLHDKSVVFYLISVGFEIVVGTVFCSANVQF